MNIGVFVYNFLLFSTLKKKPSRSRRSASVVKEKCVRGQEWVRWGVKEKCVRGQGEVHWGSRGSAYAEYVVFSWGTSPWSLTHFSLTPGALLLDPLRTSPWPLTHFSLTPDALLLDLEGLFFRVENSKKLVKEKYRIILYWFLVVKS